MQPPRCLDVCTVDPMCNQDTMNWTDLLSGPPTIFFLLYSKLLDFIFSAACSSLPHCDINKCYHLSQTGTSPTNFATWKPIWNSTHSGDVQQPAWVLCNRSTFQQCFCVFWFLQHLYLLQLDLLQYFQPQFIQISFLQSKVIPSGQEETLAVLLISLCLTNIPMISSQRLWITNLSIYHNQPLKFWTT